jgi:hypothetical protein
LLHRVGLPLLGLIVAVPTAAIAQPASLTPPTASPPTVTQVLPANLAGVLLINTTLENWDSLNRFNPLPFKINGPPGLPFLPLGVNFQVDVQPWIGDWAAVALMLPKPQGLPRWIDPEAPIPDLAQSTVMVMSVKNEAGRDIYIDKVKEIQVDPPVETTYNGITILEWSAVEPTFPTEPPSEPLPPEASPETPTPPPEETTPTSEALSRRIGSPADFLLRLQQTPAPIAVDTVPPPVPWGKPGLAVAVMPGYVVMSSTGQAIKQLIDAQTSLSPLANSPKFTQTYTKPNFNRALAVGYADIAIASQLQIDPAGFPFPPGGAPMPMPFSPTAMISAVLSAFAEVYSSTDVLWWAQDEGLRAQSTFYFNTPQPQYATEATANPDQIFLKLPAATYFLGSSRNFKKQWNNVIEEAGEEGKPYLDNLREGFRSFIGLDIDEDLVPWMDGDYVGFFFPSTQGLFPLGAEPLKVGFGLMIQTSDRTAADAALAKLNDHVVTASMNNVRVVQQEGAFPITSWEVEVPGKGNQSIFAYSWSEDNTLIMTTGTGPLSSLMPQPRQPLGNTYTFQTATNSFPQPNDGYFYLNFGALLSFVYTFLPPDYDNTEFATIGKRVLGSFRSLSVTSSATADQIQSDALLVIAPAP